MALLTINRPVAVVANLDEVVRPRRLSRRGAAVGTALITAVGVGVAVTEAVASPSLHASTTNVPFVSLSPAFTLFTNKAFAANAKFGAVVIGGTTKVPTNATTVELSVTAGGAAAGFMNFYPAGNVGGGSGQFLSWNAGSSDTATIEENVGTANQLTFANGSTASKATAKIIGYSTKVTDGDIAPADGSAGQVLTNTGTGAAWQTMGHAYQMDWTIPVTMSATQTFTQIGTPLTVPAGDYLATATLTVTGPLQSIEVQCVIAPVSNPHDSIAQIYTGISAGAPITAAALQGLFVSPAGESIGLFCDDNGLGLANTIAASLVATQVSGTSGTLEGN